MSEKFNFYFNIVTKLLCAIGPIILGTIAIYGDKIKSALIKPKLTISVNRESPCVELITNDVSSSSHSNSCLSYFIVRVKVENTGSIPARNCVAMAQKVWKMDDNGTYIEYKKFAPTQFLWFNDQKEYTIPREIQSYLEIIRIKKTELNTDNSAEHTESGDNNKSLIYLSIPESGKKGVFVRLGSGKFIISIVIFAEDRKCSDEKFLDVFWNGHEIEDNSKIELSILSKSEVKGKVNL